MEQYLTHLKKVKEQGVYKPAARPRMPGSISLFGYQNRYNLSNGFPILTTKKMFWKGIVIELMWFLRGGKANIKYLVDNGVNIWNEDAYNYYKKTLVGSDGFVELCQPPELGIPNATPGNCGRVNFFSFDEFIDIIKNVDEGDLPLGYGYRLGDCGFQYPRLWRAWRDYFHDSGEEITIDQLSDAIEQIRKSPESRRHIVTAIDPSNSNDVALYPCHALMQFNCRPLSIRERNSISSPLNPENSFGFLPTLGEALENESILDRRFDELGVPKYKLDCQMYQRSADMILGVPFNISSYALLTHIVAKMCNMVPGEFIHTFGDSHIYENHFDAYEEQIKRVPGQLPFLNIVTDPTFNWAKASLDDVVWKILGSEMETFCLRCYEPQSGIKAELSTGM